jgi:hypothetical protein
MAGVPWYASISLVAFVLLTSIAIGGAEEIAKIFPEKEVNINEWHFNPDTGEYGKITTSNKKGYLYNASTYQERYTYQIYLYEKYVSSRRYLIMAAICVFGGFFVNNIFAYIAMAAYAVMLLVVTSAYGDYDGYDVGPKPVEPKAEPFGPETTSGATNGAAVDLSY